MLVKNNSGQTIVLGSGGVNTIQTFGLDQFVNKSASKSGEKSLGLIMRRRLAAERSC
jgi:hypothetical protein